MASPTFQQVSKLLLDALRIWRQPLPAKAGAIVVYAGVALLMPGIRDFLLAILPAVINWTSEKLRLELRVPVMETAPWWTGLVLVGAGLLFLLIHARQRAVVLKVEVTGGKVVIELAGPENVVDNPALAAILQKALEQGAQPPSTSGPAQST